MERGIYDAAGAIEQINKANYKDNVYSAGLKASYVWIFGNDVRVTPSFGLDFSQVRLDGTSESNDAGGVLAQDALLSSRKESYSNLAIPLMVSANRTFSSDFLSFKGAQSLWTLEVRARYVRGVGRKRADINFVDGNNGAWKTLSARFAGSYGTVGGGLKMKLADRYIFNVDYDYTFGKEYENHSLTAMYGVSF